MIVLIMFANLLQEGREFAMQSLLCSANILLYARQLMLPTLMLGLWSCSIGCVEFIRLVCMCMGTWVHYVGLNKKKVVLVKASYMWKRSLVGALVVMRWVIIFKPCTHHEC